MRRGWHGFASDWQITSAHDDVAVSAAKAPQAKSVLERQIAATDRQIDNLVYELYGLTEEEIKIVEGSST